MVARLKLTGNSEKQLNQFKVKAKSASNVVSRGVTGIVSRTIANIRRDTQKSMRGQKTGRFYAFQGRRVQASAPGETPAVRSGNLVNSLVSFTQRRADRIVGIARTNVTYAKYILRKDRPIFRPALDFHKKIFIKAVDKVVRESFS